MKIPWENIEEVTKYLKDNGLSEITVETKEGKITIKKDAEGIIHQVPAASQAAPASAATPASTESSDSGLIEITAPMVGTYYSAPTPGADPFIKVGSKVNKGDVVCIIEAMKIMNELPSEVSGTVKEILVNNEEIVEFGQVIARVEP